MISTVVDEDVPLTRNTLERLWQSIRCPACDAIGNIPIHVCIEGHNLCNYCAKLHKYCPWCCGPFDGMRNFITEDITRSVPLPCPISSHGRDCVYRLPDDNFTSFTLKSKSLLCPVKSCSKSIWYYEIDSHFRINHSSVERMYESRCGVHLAAAKILKTYYFFSVIYVPPWGVFFFGKLSSFVWVQLFGSDIDSCMFKFELEISNKFSDYKKVLNGPVMSVEHSLTTIFREGNHATLSFKTGPIVRDASIQQYIFYLKIRNEAVETATHFILK